MHLNTLMARDVDSNFHCAFLHISIWLDAAEDCILCILCIPFLLRSTSDLIKRSDEIKRLISCF